eukprot:5181426-Amphidinium_carterae.1
MQRIFVSNCQRGDSVDSIEVVSFSWGTWTPTHTPKKGRETAGAQGCTLDSLAVCGSCPARVCPPSNSYWNVFGTHCIIQGVVSQFV